MFKVHTKYNYWFKLFWILIWILDSEPPDSKTKIIRRFYCRIFKKPSRDYNERLVSISLFIDDNSEARWTVFNYDAAEGKKRNVFRGLNSHNEMFAYVAKVVKPESLYVLLWIL